eukprot:scaffold338_cov361-Pavlova_lutheri.AAC.40
MEGNTHTCHSDSFFHDARPIVLREAVEGRREGRAHRTMGLPKRSRNIRAFERQANTCTSKPSFIEPRRWVKERARTDTNSNLPMLTRSRLKHSSPRASRWNERWAGFANASVRCRRRVDLPRTDSRAEAAHEVNATVWVCFSLTSPRRPPTKGGDYRRFGCV